MPDTNYVHELDIDLDTPYQGLEIFHSLIGHYDQLPRYHHLKTIYCSRELRNTQICYFDWKKLAPILYVPT